MRDIPVIMSAPMVLATLREIEKPGTGKTNTRRYAWGPRFEKAIDDEGGRPGWRWGVWRHGECVWPSKKSLIKMGLPADTEMLIGHMAPSNRQSAKAEDQLWVRETWRASYDWDCYSEKLGRCPRPSDITPGHIVEYLADDTFELGGQTRVAIHMPRWASRITLIVTAVKIERLQAISEADAKAEGVESTAFHRDDRPLSICFSLLWESLHGAGAWATDPEVVAIAFKPTLANIDMLPAPGSKPGVADDHLMAG